MSLKVIVFNSNINYFKLLKNRFKCMFWSINYVCEEDIDKHEISYLFIQLLTVNIFHVFN